jgi:nucleotide-binding universal stress UspA family protein
MFQHILVPLDGSPRAEQALLVAARLARASGGRITLLRVVDITNTCIPSLSLEPVVVQSIIEGDRDEANSYMEGIAQEEILRDIPTQKFVLVGQVAPVILGAADRYHPDVIVINSHGRTGFSRWMLGSVAEKVAHHATIPVLLLRDSKPMLKGFYPDEELPFRILVPLDGSPLAEAAIAPSIDLAKALAPPHAGALHLAQIVMSQDTENSYASEKEAMKEQAKDYLANLVKHLHDRNASKTLIEEELAITWSVSIDDDIASGIERVAQGGENIVGAGVFGKCQAIAMATHGRSGIQRWTMGSITERVLHTTTFPILIVRPTTSGK